MNKDLLEKANFLLKTKIEIVCHFQSHKLPIIIYFSLVHSYQQQLQAIGLSYVILAKVLSRYIYMERAARQAAALETSSI